MTTPYFSVVIDNFNYGRFLAQAIDSVLGQDFPAGEVETVVVDDGSTDDSREVAGRYKDKIRLIAQKNGGQAAAFAAGFAAARGQVICTLDSDDYWHTEKLSAVARRLQDPTLGIIQHYQRDVDASGRPLQNPMADWPDRYRLTDLLDGRFINAATSSLAIRRSVLDQVLPVPSDVFYLYDDYLLDHGLFISDIGNIPRILGYHRIHGANNWAMNYLNPDKLESSIKELHAFRAHLEPKLRARGLFFSPRSRALRDMEIHKREILVAMHRGDRSAAFGVWKGLVSRHGRTPFGFFRCATCFLALISPNIYFRAYGLYGRLHWLARARSLVLPEPLS